MNRDTLIRATRFQELSNHFGVLAANEARPGDFKESTVQHARERIKALLLLVNVAEGAPVAEAVKGAS
jgi:hypothetical protein